MFIHFLFKVLIEQELLIVVGDNEKRVDLTENEISSLWRLYGSEGGNSGHKSAQNNIMNIMKATQYLRLSFFQRENTETNKNVNITSCKGQFLISSIRDFQIVIVSCENLKTNVISSFDNIIKVHYQYNFVAQLRKCERKEGKGGLDRGNKL